MGKRALDDQTLRTRLLDLIRAGHGRYESAILVGITTETYRQYYRDRPEFREEVEAAVDASVEPVLAMLRKEGLAGDITAAKEWLKHNAPAPRGEVQKIEVDVKHQLDPTTVATLTDLRARLQGRVADPELEAGDIIDVEEIEEDYS